MNIDRFRDSPHLSDVPISHPCPTDPTCPYCNGSIDTHSKIGFNWSFVDGVYCISLNTRGDRTASAAAQFHRVGLCRYVLFYRPTKHPKSTVIGIWNSHRTVGEHARQRGCLRAMIFEDDVLFTHHLRPQRLRAIARALDTLPPDWMIFFLGHWPLSGYFVRPNVLKTNSACAHAYITSSRLLEWLHSHPYGAPVKIARIAGVTIDAAYARLPATYAIFPMIAVQSTSKSDHLTYNPNKKTRKVRHFITHSKHRERLLSKLMRPNEIFILMLCPVFFALHLALKLVSKQKNGFATRNHS